MERNLAVRLLQALLPGPHPDAELAQLFRELKFLADYKYNKYEMYQPGRLFLESLCAWLMGFDPSERGEALKFVRERLIFVSRQEFRQLAGVVMRDSIRPLQLRLASERSGIPEHRIARLLKSEVYKDICKASLYVGLSDGARIDMIRRHNLDISNEQVLPYYAVSRDKVDDALDALKTATAGRLTAFECLFLIDDFCGSGHTLLREVVTAPLAAAIDASGLPGRWRGSLRWNAKKQELELSYTGGVSAEDEASLRSLRADAGFQAAIAELVRKSGVRETIAKGSLTKIAEREIAKAITPNAVVAFLPLLMTEHAQRRLRSIIPRLAGTFGKTSLLPGAILAERECFRGTDTPIGRLCDRYYEDGYGDVHTGDVKYGFDHCGLPLVLHHNTPNNSLYLLWHRNLGPARSPLFVRYERHGREVG